MKGFGNMFDYVIPSGLYEGKRIADADIDIAFEASASEIIKNSFLDSSNSGGGGPM